MGVGMTVGAAARAGGGACTGAAGCAGAGVDARADEVGGGGVSVLLAPVRPMRLWSSAQPPSVSANASSAASHSDRELTFRLFTKGRFIHFGPSVTGINGY